MYITPDFVNEKGEVVEKKPAEEFDYMSMLRKIGLVVMSVMLLLNLTVVLFIEWPFSFDIPQEYSAKVDSFLGSALSLNMMTWMILIPASIAFSIMQICDWVKNAKNYPTKSKIQTVVFIVLAVMDALFVKCIFDRSF